MGFGQGSIQVYITVAVNSVNRIGLGAGADNSVDVHCKGKLLPL